MKQLTGNLITLGMAGVFDVILHGANCFCTMGGGIAREIRARVPEAYQADQDTFSGDRNKIGLFTKAGITCYIQHGIVPTEHKLTVINAYTQYDMSSGEDVFEYEAFDRVLKLIHRMYPTARVGLPLIGCGLAGGDESRIRWIIEENAKVMDLTLVLFDPNAK
jgi:O-acetyl-ADP-ribose deacetylase (regulator of RNase III)